MRHRKEGKKFHRVTGRRRAFLRNMVGNLVRSGKIETTETRAKAVRPLVEHLVTIAKKQNLAARRLLISRLHNTKVALKLYEEIGPRYQDRKGGYLRIVKSSKARKRDGSNLATIEFI